MIFLDLNELTPFVRVAMDNVINPPWNLSERVIFDHELLYIKNGNIKINIDGVVYEGKKGDVFLIKPKAKHSMTLCGNESFHQPHMHFDLFYKKDSKNVLVSFKNINQMSDAEKLLFREPIDLPDKLHISNIKYFEELLFDIIREYQLKMPFYELNLKSMVIKLLTFLLKEQYSHENFEVKQNYMELVKIRDFLRENINRDVHLNNISTEFNISKYHLSRLFKKAFGLPPIYYHTLLRMEKAKELIKFTNLSITQISDKLGYSSINAFSRAFKAFEGVSPKYYR